MPTYPKKITMDHTPRAIKDLGINTPFTARLVRNRLEIHPLGAAAPVYWPPLAPSPTSPQERREKAGVRGKAKPRRSTAKAKPSKGA